MMWFAARFREEWRNQGKPRERESLVVCEADSPAEAQVLTGLTLEEFRPATEVDHEEWNELCEQPLTRREVDSLLRMIGRTQRALGRRRLRDREETIDERTGEVIAPRWDPLTPAETDLNRAQARLLAELAGKIEALGEVEALDQD